MDEKLDVVFPAVKPEDKTGVFGAPGRGVVAMVGSTGGYDDGFLARIVLAPGVNLQLFPKYGLVAMEVADNGNTNLPVGCSSEELLGHMFGDEVRDPSKEGEDEEPVWKDLPKGMVIANYVDGATPVPRERVLEAIKTLKQVAKEKAAEWKLSLGRGMED